LIRRRHGRTKPLLHARRRENGNRAEGLCDVRRGLP
jgi:hypothetical protein